MGIAAYPRDGRTPEALVEAATPAIHPGASEGHSAAMVSALARLEPIVTRVAAGTITVLLLGETGVGKDVLARTIHARSPRASKPIVCINCAALSESLLESELFGHEKGAFTGATHEKHGLIEAAAGGTVFLDEIGEMPLSVQAKLLRVIEQREVLRVGAVAPRSVDVRFLAATNRDLDVEVAEKRFRQDLYFRLNAISLVIPPLRDRLDEIEPLARGFIAEACQRAGLRAPVALDPDALALLKNYRWPGNIRELRNVIERAVLLCGDGVIQLVHLPTEKMGALLPPPSRLPTGIAHLAIRSPVAPRSVPAPRQTLPTMSGEEPSGAEIERARIVAALEQCGGNQSDAARALGISRSTLISRIQTYGLPRPRKREDDK